MSNEKPVSCSSQKKRGSDFFDRWPKEVVLNAPSTLNGLRVPNICLEQSHTNTPTAHHFSTQSPDRAPTSPTQTCIWGSTRVTKELCVFVPVCFIYVSPIWLERFAMEAIIMATLPQNKQHRKKGKYQDERSFCDLSWFRRFSCRVYDLDKVYIGSDERSYLYTIYHSIIAFNSSKERSEKRLTKELFDYSSQLLNRRIICRQKFQRYRTYTIHTIMPLCQCTKKKLYLFLQ